MKKSSILSAILACGLLSATPVSAGNLYVSGSVGLNAPTNSVTNYSYSSNSEDVTYFLKSGGALLGAVGCDYGSFRLEGELGYQTFKVNQATAIYNGGAPNVIAASGNGHVFSFLANGYYDLPVGKSIKPYVTAGVGLANVRFADLSFYENAPTYDMDSTALAYQIGAGVAVPVSKKVTIDARYRYFGTGLFNIPEFAVAVYNPVGCETSFHTHQVLLGMRVDL
jgi:opacity protein-like surface antigen